MKFRNSFLALSLAAVTFAPAALAQGDNDYAPSASPSSEPAPAAPPPSLENTQMQGRAGAGGPGGWQGGGARKRMKGLQGAGPGGAKGQGPGRAKIMAKFDANGDGTLDEAERAKLQEFRAQRKQARLGKQGGLGNASSGEPGAGPSGAPSANFAGGPGAGAFAGGAGPGGRGGANKQARMQKLIQRFDTDGDGVLNAKEQAEADSFRAQRRQQRMMQQGGAVGLGGKPGKGLPTLPIAPDGGTGSAAGDNK